MNKVLAGVLALACWAGPAAGADVPDLVKKLRSPDSDVRRAAARELADAGAEAKPAVGALAAALKDRDLFVRRFAAQALGAIGPDARPAVPALRAALGDRRGEVQEAAAVALGKVGGPDGVSALAAAVRDPNRDAGVRRKSAEALGSMGKEARAAVPALTAVLKGAGPRKGKGKKKMAPDDDVRVDAARALGEVATAEDESAVEALRAVATAKGGNRELKRAAADALRKLTGKGPRKKK
jgi:HEAT repeat protein